MPAFDAADGRPELGILTSRGLLAGLQVLRLLFMDFEGTTLSEGRGEQRPRTRGPKEHVFEAEVTLRPGGGNVVILKRVP